MKGTEVLKNNQRLRYVVADWLTTNVAFLVFNIFRYFILYGERGIGVEPFLLQPTILIEQAIIPVCALGIYWLSGYYLQPFNKSRLQELLTTICSAFITGPIIYFALLTNDQVPRRLDNWKLLASLIFFLWGFVYLGRVIITQYARSQQIRRQWSFNTLIVGNSQTARALARQLSMSRQVLGYKVVGFVELPEETQVRDGEPSFSLEDVGRVVKEYDVTSIILAPETLDDTRILSILYDLFPLNIPIRIAPDSLSFVTSSIHLQDIYGEPFIDLTSPSVSNSSIVIKRFSDVILSSLALIATSPLMIALAIAVKLDSKGPAFYSQERIGLHHRPFRIYKFRTMKTDAEKEGPQLSSDDDPRITRVGKIFRKYRLDELPQFWNILKGEMSLVGPRPEREYYIQKIVKEAPYYTLIHQVRPGLTSWGMVKYGYASTVEEMVRRTRFDLIYLSNMSLAVDLKILIYTIKTVLGGKGK